MDLEKAKLQLADLRENQLSFVNEEDKNNKDNEFIKDAEAIECILTALDNSVSKDEIKEKIEELNLEEHELQKSISDEERQLYSDANISYELCDIEVRRSELQELLNKGE